MTLLLVPVALALALGSQEQSDQILVLGQRGGARQHVPRV
jgi:hypothetical protein